MAWLKEKWNACTPKARVFLQCALGVPLASLCWFFLSASGGPQSGAGNFNLLIAAALALVPPRILRAHLDDPLRALNLSMAVTLAALILISLALTLSSSLAPGAQALAGTAGYRQ